jgi:GT2 family glycosyltransferase
MSEMPSVDVIVVMWNTRLYVDDLFRGLRAVQYPRDRLTIHIVDNASPDGAGAYVKQLLAHPDAALPRIILHEPGVNLGFAGGNNLVMRDSKADYCYLLNHDAVFQADTLRETVLVAEAHPNAGSVQSLLVLMQNPAIVNSLGNDIHFAAFGYCRGYLDPVSAVSPDVRPITFSSGAGVLYRTSALRTVGFFDEALFAYHEDLDLGWRLLLAGYDNLLAPKSVLQHKYEFSRSIAKWYWMERNRWAVYLINYRFGTILLTLPAMIAIEIATWFFAFRGGWFKEKWRATVFFLKWSTWAWILNARRHAQSLRRRTDRAILERFVYAIDYQDVKYPFMTWVANPLMQCYFAALKAVVRW